MRKDETEIECLRRKLDRRLGPDPSKGKPCPDWKIYDMAGQFHRPLFTQHLYPYQVPHITESKEIKKLFVVSIPGECLFEIPANYGIESVSLMELMKSGTSFGPVAAAIPYLVSRYHFVCLES